MNLVKLLKFTVSMMNVSASMEHLLFGDTVPKYLITYHCLLLSMERFVTLFDNKIKLFDYHFVRYFVSMEACHLLYKIWMTFV